MPTVVKTWSFATDAEGLADAGGSSSIAFAYEGGDGSASAGCVKFTTAVDGLVNETEQGRKVSTADTWETWGVPGGATVTNVQVTAWKAKLADDTGLSEANDCKLTIQAVDASAVSVTDADLIGSQNITSLSWTAMSAGSLRGVISGKQTSSTPVRLELEVRLSTDDPSTSVDVRFDSIELTITYDDGTTGGAVTPPVASVVMGMPQPNFPFAGVAMGMSQPLSVVGGVGMGMPQSNFPLASVAMGMSQPVAFQAGVAMGMAQPLPVVGGVAIAMSQPLHPVGGVAMGMPQPLHFRAGVAMGMATRSRGACLCCCLNADGTPREFAHDHLSIEFNVWLASQLADVEIGAMARTPPAGFPGPGGDNNLYGYVLAFSPDGVDGVDIELRAYSDEGATIRSVASANVDWATASSKAVRWQPEDGAFKVWVDDVLVINSTDDNDEGFPAVDFLVSVYGRGDMTSTTGIHLEPPLRVLDLDIVAGLEL